jgi:hypothetical protein
LIKPTLEFTSSWSTVLEVILALSCENPSKLIPLLSRKSYGRLAINFFVLSSIAIPGNLIREVEVGKSYIEISNQQTYSLAKTTT